MPAAGAEEQRVGAHVDSRDEPLGLARDHLVDQDHRRRVRQDLLRSDRAAGVIA